MRLEYRLVEENQQYPALWHYYDISKSEAAARMTCEYFVKNNETYKVTATALDPDGTAVIYVDKEEFSNDTLEKYHSHIGFETRELTEQGSILIDQKEIWEHDEVLAALHSDFIYIKRGEKFLEFAMDSREIDEDRKCYVYYGNFTGNSR
ncbi:hypothetical protein ACFPA1_25880 [Neobacillus sp. GCM10023253]|uniref:hypothetical protein n=1 Tax=Neobacillus sp. GCM10023253 TaxID=3252644 RepID=UPI00361CAB40